MPIYKATITAQDKAKGAAVEIRLIEAATTAGALKFAAENIGIERATPADIIELTKAGVELEQAA